MSTPPSRRAATILDVAARAGVSKSVVSLVLRGTGYVSAAKRTAVETAMAELDYRPNAAARAMGESRSRTVGVVLNDMRNPWFVSAVEGLNATLNEHGMQMLMGDFRLDSRSGESLLRKLLEMNIEGLVLVGTMPPSGSLAAAAAQVPTVVLGAPSPPGPNVTVVTNDDGAGARLAVEHLIGIGHRSIAHVAAPGTAVGAARQRGYEQSMATAGLESFVQVAAGGLTEEEGYRAGIGLLSGRNRPSAVFAVNDMAALGVLSAAEELGLAVPADLSVAGYDNTPLAQLRRISLTSVDNASREAGQRAAEILLARLVPGSAVPQDQMLPPTLEVRGSTAAPRPAMRPTD
ncbi:LacI family DNA-binding transcriptional regulator [Arthrobacter sp. 35W]|uniref:LacI family DNA-binding transcriptional regulator n=1 Tax=Arthrobacter sp. 35W TaxID=1132441 RepID=UPI00041E7DE6|nr:LacI family DNA-binding transcriptional regulator [Arthrobacter sp. 35W]